MTRDSFWRPMEHWPSLKVILHYLEFRDKNKVMPAIFAIDEELRESMVNSKVDSKIENLIIIEQVFPKLALRHNDKVLCIFNEAFRPY